MWKKAHLFLEQKTVFHLVKMTAENHKMDTNLMWKKAVSNLSFEQKERWRSATDESC